MVIVGGLVVFVRLRLLSVPFERDEGEFAYQAQLLLKGYFPFETTYNMKLPGTSLMYSLFFLFFGQSVKSIHFGLLLMNISTAFFIYKIAKNVFSPISGTFSFSSYLILSLSITHLGFAAHATHFVVFYFTAALWFFLKQENSFSLLKTYFVGILIGLSFIMKQHALFFIILIGVLYILAHINLKYKLLNILTYTVGVFTPYILVVLFYIFRGSFDSFWFWTVEYAQDYASGFNLAQGWYSFRFSIAKATYGYRFFWFFGFLGIVIMMLKPELIIRQKIAWFSTFIFSFLAITPGFHFREHYYILLLPILSIFIGYGLTSLFQYLSVSLTLFNSKNIIISVKKAPISIFLFYGFLLFAITLHFKYHFSNSSKQVCVDAYGQLPFPVSKDIAEVVRNYTDEDDNVFVLGSEPQILFYANRLPATGYLYIYGAMENHNNALKMQKQIINEVEKNRPKVVVALPMVYWGSTWNSHLHLTEWSNQFAKNYTPIAFWDINEDEMGKVVFVNNSKEVQNYNVLSNRYIAVFVRNEN